MVVDCLEVAFVGSEDLLEFFIIEFLVDLLNFDLNIDFPAELTLNVSDKHALILASIVGAFLLFIVFLFFL